MYRMGMEEVEAVAKVIKSGNLSRLNEGLNEVDCFEEELAKIINVEYALCVSSGTTALISALVGLGIGPGDEVIVPSYTFMAAAIAALAVGAIPIITEIDDTLTIDPEDIEKKISPYTKVIIPVHIWGLPCNMNKIMEIANKHNLKVLEDACQAVGGSYKGNRLGSIGDVGAFSFNNYKIISSGEGGAVLTNNRSVYERALIYHDGGTYFRQYAQGLDTPIFTGQQYRVSEISGAILRVQLGRLDGILHDLRRVKQAIMDKLAGEKNISFPRTNDVDGDCATILAFSFKDEVSARKFASSEGIGGWIQSEAGKHVYSNWEPVLSKRGAHHESVNPYRMPQNVNLNMNYSKDMCPISLNLLSRTVIIHLHPDWDGDKINYIVSSCRKAAKNL